MSSLELTPVTPENLPLSAASVPGSALATGTTPRWNGTGWDFLGGDEIDITNSAYGDAAGDGSDATAAIALAVADLAEGDVLVIPDGDFLNNTLHTIPAGCSVRGNGRGSVITGLGFLLNSGCTVSGVKFQKGSTAHTRAIRFNTSTAVSDVLVARCWFDSYATAGVQSAKPTSGVHENIRVRDCHFTSNGVGVYMLVANRCLVEGCSFSGNTFNVLFNGGEYNRVIGNNVDGGTTGISFAYHKTNATTSVIRGNTVMGNVIKGVTEEGISLDLRGNDVNQAVFERDTIATKPGSNVFTLTDTGWTGSASHVGYYMVFSSGSLQGRVYPITAHTNNSFTVTMTAEDYALATVADEVLVGAPLHGNTIIGNTVEASSDTEGYHILLYGFCYGNTVVGNTVRGFGSTGGAGDGGIYIANIGELTQSGPVTGNLVKAPSEHNVIVGNTVQGNIGIEYFEYGATLADHVALGNIIEGNSVGGTYVIETALTALQLAGSGTPESAVAAPVGSTYRRVDGGANTSFYVKESGTGNTGWVAK